MPAAVKRFKALPGVVYAEPNYVAKAADAGMPAPAMVSAPAPTPAPSATPIAAATPRVAPSTPTPARTPVVRPQWSAPALPAVQSLSSAALRDSQNVELVGQIGGVSYAVAVSGTLAYVGVAPAWSS